MKPKYQVGDQLWALANGPRLYEVKDITMGHLNVYHCKTVEFSNLTCSIFEFDLFRSKKELIESEISKLQIKKNEIQSEIDYFTKML